MKVVKGDGNGNLAFRITDIAGDMGEPTRLDLIQQADGDVIVVLRDIETGVQLAIEFCTLFGGGRNPIISQKTLRLI